MKSFLKECFSFRGRWGRMKFWLYPLVFLLPMVIAIIINMIFLSLGYSKEAMDSNIILNTIMILSAILMIAFLFVSIFAYIKRFHDLNRSGWWILLAMIPFIGIIFWVYAAFFKGTEGENRFGPDPLESGSSEKKDEVKTKKINESKIEL